MMGMHWAMWLLWLLLIALVGWGLYRLLTRSRKSSSRRETPLQLLERRYAAGEISGDEFEERRRKLNEGN